VYAEHPYLEKYIGAWHSWSVSYQSTYYASRAKICAVTCLCKPGMSQRFAKGRNWSVDQRAFSR